MPIEKPSSVTHPTDVPPEHERAKVDPAYIPLGSDRPVAPEAGLPQRRRGAGPRFLTGLGLTLALTALVALPVLFGSLLLGLILAAGVMLFVIFAPWKRQEP